MRMPDTPKSPVNGTPVFPERRTAAPAIPQDLWNRSLALTRRLETLGMERRRFGLATPESRRRAHRVEKSFVVTLRSFQCGSIQPARR